MIETANLPQHPSPLEQAVHLAEGQSALARKITALGKKCSQQNVWWWLNKGGAIVPAEFVPFVSAAVGGVVSKQDLRPDLWQDQPLPPPADSAAPARQVA